MKFLRSIAIESSRSPKSSRSRASVPQSAGDFTPAAGLKSPALWGTEVRLRELFGERLDKIAVERKNFVFRYHSATHWLEIFRTFYGPMHKAFGALDAEKQEALAADLIALAERFNRATDGTLVAPSEYLEVVINFG